VNQKVDTRQRNRVLAEEIVGNLTRKHSTAVVLFHHAVAERLGLGPTDHKCLDLLRERGASTGSELVAITGLTSGAITGVVARLERAGYLRRDPDPDDRRKQILNPVREKAREINDVLGPIRADVAGLLEGLDSRQLAAIAEFLSNVTDLAYRHASLLRAQMLYAASRSRGAAQSSAVDEASRGPGTNGKHRRKYSKKQEVRIH
jgi:DNA-binding MarR family transcriptional regulator